MTPTPFDEQDRQAGGDANRADSMSGDAMKEKKVGPKLTELVQQLMDTLGQTQREIEEERPYKSKGKFFGPASDFDWSFSAAMSDPAVEEIANRLLEELGEKNHFEGPDEITVFLVEEFGRLFDQEEISDEEFARRQAEALTKPLCAMAVRSRASCGLAGDRRVQGAGGDRRDRGVFA